MKTLKTLVAIFAITLITSSFGVFAYGTGVLTITNASVPGFNGSWNSAGRTKVTSGDQKVTGVSTTRSLDMQLHYYNTATGGWKTGGTTWYILNTNKNVTFLSEGVTSYYPSLMMGDYRLHIDSRITYINGTTINSAKYNPGN